MGEIINFWEAKRAIEMRELQRTLREEIAETQGVKPPQKRAKVISALPGEAVPPEYEDLRPYLQRDGLILLSWARWENYEGDGLSYRVHWVKSIGKLKRYACFWLDITNGEEMSDVLPDRKGDYYYREGEIGYSRKKVADVVFICAPELTAQTRPHFIKKLIESGVNVDFNLDFSLGYAKQLEYKRQVEEINVLNPHPAVWGQTATL